MDDGIRCVVLEDVRRLLNWDPSEPLPSRVQVFNGWVSSQSGASLLPWFEGCDVYCKQECSECHSFFTNSKAQASHATMHAKQGKAVEFTDAYVQEPVQDVRYGRAFERKVSYDPFTPPYLFPAHLHLTKYRSASKSSTPMRPPLLALSRQFPRLCWRVGMVLERGSNCASTTNSPSMTNRNFTC